MHIPPSPLLRPHVTKWDGGRALPALERIFLVNRGLPTARALDRGVEVGLGSDIAGGYELGIQGAMRMSVAVSRLREGLLKRESQTPGKSVVDNPRIDWKESLYLATKGGGSPSRMVQCRSAVRRSTKCVDCKLTLTLVRRTDMSAFILVVCLYDPTTGEGVGSLDFLDGRPFFSSNRQKT